VTQQSDANNGLVDADRAGPHCHDEHDELLLTCFNLLDWANCEALLIPNDAFFSDAFNVQFTLVYDSPGQF